MYGPSGNVGISCAACKPWNDQGGNSYGSDDEHEEGEEEEEEEDTEAPCLADSVFAGMCHPFPPGFR